MNPSFFALLVLSACLVEGGRPADDELECGAGTHEESGVCVVDSLDTAETGDTGDTEESGDSGQDTGTGDSSETGVDTGGDTDTDTGGDTGGDPDSGSGFTVCASGGGTYTELQDAVDDASDGDVITVCAGTYDYVEMSRLEVTIIGESREAVWVDGGSHAAFTLDDCTLTLSELSLTGSESASGGATALVAVDSTVSLSDLTVDGSVAGGPGVAGMLFTDSDVTLADAEFADNELTHYAVEVSGGSFTMTHTRFHGTKVPSSGSFGGMVMNLYDTEAEVSNNLFYDNVASSGGIISQFYPKSHTQWVFNNVWYGNSNSGEPIVYLENGVRFENNIVYNPGSAGVDYSGASTVLQYNDVYGHTGYDLHNAGSGGTATDNLAADPRFNGASGDDFTLDAGFSPCVNAGNPASGYNDADGSANDMGAYGGSEGSW